MIHEVFIALNTIYLCFVVHSIANTVTSPPTVAQTPAATQLTPVGASVPQSACPNLSALPVLSSSQKEVWILGRATKTQVQSDPNINNCQLLNYGTDCQALQLTVVPSQDGKTRDVTMYAYNMRTDTVAFRRGKHVQTDGNYETYREEMQTELFITRDGATLMASTSIPAQATSQGVEFAKLAESKDGNWSLLQTCDQLMTMILFRADLVASDPQRSFVEYYRQSIDDTLRQLKINTQGMVEVQLTFPYAVQEVPNNINYQQPGPAPVSASIPQTQTQSAPPSPPSNLVYISAPKPPPTVAQSGPPAVSPPTVMYVPAPAPSYMTPPPIPVQYSPPVSPPVPPYAYPPPSPYAAVPPPIQTPYNPPVSSTVVPYAAPPVPYAAPPISYAATNPPTSPPVVSYASPPPLMQPSSVVNAPPYQVYSPPPMTSPPYQVPSSPPISPPPVAYPNPPPLPPAIVYAPPPAVQVPASGPPAYSPAQYTNSVVPYSSSPPTV